MNNFVLIIMLSFITISCNLLHSPKQSTEFYDTVITSPDIILIDNKNDKFSFLIKYNISKKFYQLVLTYTGSQYKPLLDKNSELKFLINNEKIVLLRPLISRISAYKVDLIDSAEYQIIYPLNRAQLNEITYATNVNILLTCVNKTLLGNLNSSSNFNKLKIFINKIDIDNT